MGDPSTVEVVILMRPWQRVVFGAFATAWVGALGTAVVLGVRESDVPIPAVVMLLFGIGVFASVIRRRLVAYGDRVVVRNALRTTTMYRSEIAELRIGQGSGRAGARMLLVVPHQGEAVSVEVSGQLGSRKNDRLAVKLAELQAWLDR